MKLRLLVGLAHPHRPLAAGEEIELPDDEAGRAIEAGIAVAVAAPAIVVPVVAPAIETATAPPPKETRKRGLFGRKS